MLHGRRDSTHAEVRQELRDLGASVADTADLGHDFPDLLVGFCGHDFKVEAKSPKKVHHQKEELRPGQKSFAETWRGSPVVVLRSREQAREWLIRTRHELQRESRNAAQNRTLTPVVNRRLAPLADGRYRGETPKE